MRSKKRLSKNKKLSKKGGWIDDDLHKIKIMSYNLLARGNTKYNYRYHLNLIPNEVDGNFYESNTQTLERYTYTSDDILNYLPDIVCLQECDINYFSNIFNQNFEELDSQYEIIHQIDKLPIEKQSGGNVSILLRRDSKLASYQYNTHFIYEPDKYGGTSKGALCIIFNDKSDSSSLCIISSHFQGGRNPLGRKRLLEDISRFLQEYNITNFIILGDFNTNDRNLSSEIHELGLQNYYLKVLLDTNTSLTSDFRTKIKIDHCLVSNSFKEKIFIQADDNPIPPYKVEDEYHLLSNKDKDQRLELIEDVQPSSIIKGTDHCWIIATLL